MNTENVMDCSSRIKLERQKRSWTQEQLAERARLSPRTVQRIECGAEASMETLRLIAEAFGLSAESLQAGELRTHFDAPWCRTVKIITGAIIGVVIIWSLLPLFVRPESAWSIFYHIMWGVLLFSLFWSVNGFSLKNGQLLVHRLGWATKVDLVRLSGFEINPHAMMGSIRLFGNGGLFCIIGFYRNGVLGRYQAYVTDPAKAVVLEFGDRKLVVSPDDPQAFVEALRHATKGICRETGATNQA